MDTFDLLVQKETQISHCVYLWWEKGWWGPEVRVTAHQARSHKARVCAQLILINHLQSSLLVLLSSSLSVMSSWTKLLQEVSCDSLCPLSMSFLHSIPMATTDTLPMMPSLLDLPPQSGSATKRRQSLLPPNGS